MSEHSHHDGGLAIVLKNLCRFCRTDAISKKVAIQARPRESQQDVDSRILCPLPYRAPVHLRLSMAQPLAPLPVATNFSVHDLLGRIASLEAENAALRAEVHSLKRKADDDAAGPSAKRTKGPAGAVGQALAGAPAMDSKMQKKLLKKWVGALSRYASSACRNRICF